MPKSDFYNVGELTKDFDDNTPTNRDDLYFVQVKMQFAIAQQLAVISGHLSKIVDAIERSENKGK